MGLDLGISAIWEKQRVQFRRTVAYKASHASRRGPTAPAGAGIEETFRSGRFVLLDSRRDLAIRADHQRPS